MSSINVFTRIRKCSCQWVSAILCSFICKTFSVKLPFFSELYLYWHYKLILRLAGVFSFLQKTLPFNKFAHPWYRTLDMKSNPMDSSHFENNFKRTINCPVNRANMDERSQRRSQRGAKEAQAPPLSDQNIDVYILVFHQHCTVSQDQVHCKMFFGSTTGVATHSLSNQAVMNFRDLRNIEAAFFIPACFALTYMTRAGCCSALPLWKQAWHLNYQQCRLMCSLYVTKLGPS